MPSRITHYPEKNKALFVLFCFPRDTEVSILGLQGYGVSLHY